MAAAPKRILPLGPLLSGAGSRAFLGVEARPEGPRPVVLVWVPEDVARDPKRMERLRRETEEAARLDHPNIIHVHGLDVFDEGQARVVEFADGESLRLILETAKAAGRPLPPWIAAGIIADVCFGVHYAHKLGDAETKRPIVHGNLRPETILVSFHGVAKVTGYGAMEFAARGAAASTAPQRVYLAPEQVVGDLGLASQATDLYALGAVLYEAIAGRPPFVDEADVDKAILTKRPAPLSVPGVPDALGQVVLKAMARRSVDRFPTALAMREAIEAAYSMSMPSPVDVATLMNQLFPSNSGEREARRQLLASALSPSGLHVIPDSEFDLIPAPDEPAASPPAPVATPKAPPPAANLAPAAAPRSPAPAIAASTVGAAAQAGQPKRRSGLRGAVALVGVLAAVGVGVFIGSRMLGGKALDEARAPLPAVAMPEAAPPAPPPAEDFNAELQEIAARPMRDERRGTLAVVSDPPTDVFVDGKNAGRAPVELPLQPGRHRVRVVDKAKGIEATRTVTVSPAKRAEEKFSFGTGLVIINAPPGAEIAIDGHKIGTAPFSEPVTVYEGTHSLRATLGEREPLEEKISLHSGERLKFDIQPTE